MTAITSKGQATIPIKIREYLGVSPGDQVEFAIIDGLVVIQKGSGSKAYDLGQHLFGKHSSAEPNDPGSSRPVRKAAAREKAARKHG